LLIHEGQITYKEMGLHKVLDSAKYGKGFKGLPLPLGSTLCEMTWARNWRSVCPARCERAFVMAIKTKTNRFRMRWNSAAASLPISHKIVKMYVNDVTIDMGERRALQLCSSGRIRRNDSTQRWSCIEKPSPVIGDPKYARKKATGLIINQPEWLYL
jgi:1,4-dihydroxy-6-naphthoate synthase